MTLSPSSRGRLEKAVMVYRRSQATPIGQLLSTAGKGPGWS